MENTVMVVRGGSNLRKDVRRLLSLPRWRSRCLSKGVGVDVSVSVGGVGERMGVGMFGRQTGQEKEAPCGVVGGLGLEAPRTPRAVRAAVWVAACGR